MLKTNITSIILVLVFCFSCSPTKRTKKISEKTKEVSLKNTFKEDFLIGAALREYQYKELNTVQTPLIKREFNSISPENDMKWRKIHPEKGIYFFDNTDVFVNFGYKNNMNIIGHTLVWHSRLPKWVTDIKEKEKLKNVISDHINTIVTRYKGKIHHWDVVNEALVEDGSLREKSHFFKVFGDESYIELAFSLAAKADPDAKLVYNDYNLWKPAKRQGVIRLVKNLQKKGIKIDGIGIQGHYSLLGPPIEEIENSIVAFAELGLKVSFTELDVTALPNPWELDGAAVEKNYDKYINDRKFNPYPLGLTDEGKEKLSKRYKALFNLFLKHKDKIDNITFWGVNDGQSWLNDWPIKGRRNYPLFFDRNNRPKEVYKDVVSLKNVIK